MRRKIAALVMAVFVALVVGCHKQKARQSKPNVVIFLTDTVRADHLNSYGYPRTTAPFFGAFTDVNFSFTHAYTPCSWTRPAVASLFTGTYPQAHGVQGRMDVLDTQAQTVAELLRSAGLHTAIITTNPHVTGLWQMTRGFDQVIEVMPDPDILKHGNDASVVAAQLRRALETLESPFFLYVHLIDPHAPYHPPSEDVVSFGVSETDATSVDLYDGEIHFADRFVASMLESIDSAGYADDTVVVLTADHGEELGERGAMGHGNTLYQEVVRIPLAIRVPMPRLFGTLHHGAGRTIQTTCPRPDLNVSLVDVLPTILGLAEITAPAYLEGRDLTGSLRCEPLDEVPLFFSIEKEGASLSGVLHKQTKLIIDRAATTQRIYDLETDPKENNGRIPTGQDSDLIELLSTFETATQPGLHIRLMGADGIPDNRAVQLQLRTSGTIESVRALSLESGDNWGLANNNKGLWFDGKLASRRQRAPKHMWAQDRDELVLQVEPLTATVELSVRVDGHAADDSFMRQPSLPAEGWPLAATMQQLSRLLWLRDRRSPGVYLYMRRFSDDTATTVPKELRRSLEALGYFH